MDEVSVLMKIRHPNILHFFGIWISPQGETHIVTEYVSKGCLQDFLQDQKGKIPVQTLLEIGDQVSSGMAYLEGRKIVHRDLACRNLLVRPGEQEGKLEAKISDFGLSREVEDFYSSSESKLPVKWTAVEVFRFNKHSSKSDVWSFGITLWEILSYGAIPYPDFDNTTTRTKVLAGYRMSKPEICPDVVYEVMKDCWKEDPNERPTFREVNSRIKEIIKELYPTYKQTYEAPPSEDPQAESLYQLTPPTKEDVIYN